MKKVLKNIPTVDFVSCENVTSDKYYGVSDREGRRGFIAGNEFNGGCYKAFCCAYITKGNEWIWRDLREVTSLSSFIRILITDYLSVFEFDTHKELFQWLADSV